MSKPWAIAVYVFTGLFFAAFFAWPIWQILQGGFVNADGQVTFVYLAGVFTNPIYLEGLLNSLALGAIATLGALLIGVPLALVADRCEFPARKWLMASVLTPILLPPFVGAIGVRQLLGYYGSLNMLLLDVGLIDAPVDWLGGGGRFWGMAALTALGLYPIIYLNALAALANIDPAMEEAAQNLGARRWSRFRQITLPLMRPGLFAGGTVVFIWAFTELGVPLIFDYNRITSVQIFNGLREIGQNPFPNALVIVTLAGAALIYLTGKGLFGRAADLAAVKTGPSSSPRKLGPIATALCTLFFGGVTLVALLPHAAVAGVAFSSDWYRTIFPSGLTLHNFDLALGDETTVPAIVNSLRYSVWAMLLTCALGAVIAWVLVRTKLPGRAALDTLVMLPLATPGLVLAFGYLLMSQPGRAFDFLDPVRDPTVLLVIAYAVRRLPLMVRAAVAGLEQISVNYEEAAQNLGCPPWRAAWKVTLPLLSANLLAGAILIFAQCMLEVSDSMVLAQKQQYFPITKAIYFLMGGLGNGPYLACALGVWAMVFLAITLYGASTLLGRKLGAMFRL